MRYWRNVRQPVEGGGYRVWYVALRFDAEARSGMDVDAVRMLTIEPRAGDSIDERTTKGTANRTG
jgi:hypothetical protein